MSVSLYERFLAVGTVKSLMTGKDFPCSGKDKNTVEKTEIQDDDNTVNTSETAGNSSIKQK